MKTLMTKINGINIRYYESRNEGKDAIILIHFGGSTLASWNGVIPYLKDNFHLVALDLRCHGYSDQDVETCHLDDMARDVNGLMDFLNIERAYIVGSSLGADVAISFATLFPNRTIAIVLDGGLYDLVGHDSKDQKISVDEINKYINELKEAFSGPIKEYDSKEEYLKEMKNEWNNESVTYTTIIEKSDLDKIIQKENRKYAKIQTNEAIWKFLEPLFDIRFQEYFDKINCPVLWLPDENECDNEIVKRNLKKYSTNLPYHKIVTIKGSIHAYTCMIKAKEFSEEVLTFIEEVKGL